MSFSTILTREPRGGFKLVTVFVPERETGTEAKEVIRNFGAVLLREVFEVPAREALHSREDNDDEDDD